MMSFLILATAFWLYCAAFFCVIQKPLFGLYNHKSMAPGDNSLRNISRIYTHGFVSDAIVASYLTAVPLLLGALHTLLPYFNLLTLLIIYCAIAALAVGALVAADTALYRFWQFKLDASGFTKRSYRQRIDIIHNTCHIGMACHISNILHRMPMDMRHILPSHTCYIHAMVGIYRHTHGIGSGNRHIVPDNTRTEDSPQQPKRGVLQQITVSQPLGTQPRI